MLILGNRKEHEIRYGINPPQEKLNDITRPRICKLQNHHPEICRFYKWEMIGSKRALGHFDVYNWTINGVETRNGYIEKNLKGDVYNTFGEGLACISSVWFSDGQQHTTTYTAPSDWNSSNNFIDVIGGGGAGYTVNCGGYVGAGYAGAGGGYSRQNNVSLTRGSSYYLHSAARGTTSAGAEGSWFNKTGSNAQPGSYAQGPLAGGAAYQSGSGANGGTGAYGDITHTGGYGNGCGCYFAAGGGGAGGPHGDGGSGGSGDNGPPHSNNGWSGGGGAGGGGGSVGTNTDVPATSGYGGTAWDGTIGGAYDPNADGGVAGAGSHGSGGGGGATWQSYGANGGAGGAGIEYNNGAWGSGGAGGGGGSGGWGNSFGGGGGGGWYWLGGQGVNGSGGIGGVIIQYVPSTANFMGGGGFKGF